MDFMDDMDIEKTHLRSYVNFVHNVHSVNYLGSRQFPIYRHRRDKGARGSLARARCNPLSTTDHRLLIKGVSVNAKSLRQAQLAQITESSVLTQN